jgi:hypothetical protein
MSGNGAGKGDAGAGQGFWEDLEARLKELEKYLNGEFYERIKGFWYEAYKYYVDNVLDISELEKEFGGLRESVVGGPYFYVKLRYRHRLEDGIGGFADKIQEERGIYPVSISYCGVFPMSFLGVVCIYFYDAVVLYVGDSLRRKAGVVVLDFREARVRRCEDP